MSGTPVESPSAQPAAPNPQIASTLSLARGSLDARNYRAAVTYADTVLELSPGHAEAVGIRDQARTALAHFDEAIAEARGHLGRGDAQAAARSLDTARAIDPSAASVTEIATRIAEMNREREAASREATKRPSPPPQAARETAAARPQPPPAPPPPTGATQSPRPVPSQPLPTPPAAEVPPPVRSEPPPAAPPPEPSPSTPPPSTTPSRAPETRPAEPARAGPSQEEIDEAAIRRVVATYGRAIETKDIQLFRSIKPNLSSDEERRLQQGFRAVTSQRVTLSIASIDRRGDAATAIVQRRDVLDVGGRRRTVDARQTLTFARSGGGWVITEIR